ncbi:hypothetical protein Emag_007426 [Eimeria magna]
MYLYPNLHSLKLDSSSSKTISYRLPPTPQIPKVYWQQQLEQERGVVAAHRQQQPHRTQQLSPAGAAAAAAAAAGAATDQLVLARGPKKQAGDMRPTNRLVMKPRNTQEKQTLAPEATAKGGAAPWPEEHREGLGSAGRQSSSNKKLRRPPAAVAGVEREREPLGAAAAAAAPLSLSFSNFLVAIQF